MRARSATEIARAVLRLAYPDATEAGLDAGAALLVRWGGEGVGYDLDAALALLLAEDLGEVVESAGGIQLVGPEIAPAPAERRTWRLPGRRGRGD
ncbi:hypothetical protein [Kitasatospora sp. NPDC002040]|uniref:hypothetical protein n=1 Tax=Kitasatospora sp. NPDC002040 TaxID=3154661 RepID=UPI003321E108